ncbi:hypothetical protein [Sorangium sp. So ce117]|uniref:hypothetical protein n=1 Tax=Sorangium sp. So ce117 TaxID=3133277 RepID=UPI003F6430B6
MRAHRPATGTRAFGGTLAMEAAVAARAGALRREHIQGTLGEVVAGKLNGRGDAAITVFDSTGLALQDVALARVIYAAARERGAGTAFDFFG